MTRLRRRVLQKTKFLSDTCSVPSQMIALAAYRLQSIASELDHPHSSSLLMLRASDTYTDSKAGCERPGLCRSAVYATHSASPPAWREFRAVCTKVRTCLVKASPNGYRLERALARTGASGFGQHSSLYRLIFRSLPPAIPPPSFKMGQRARVEAEQKLYASLRERYEIVVEEPPSKVTSAEVGR